MIQSSQLWDYRCQGCGGGEAASDKLSCGEPVRLNELQSAENRYRG